ncbi:MAG: hypothetical protein HWN65_10405 [Candidatus Helarchaeota archaeon]|nr:hypothetical protein [Candidatus Helarchaeota archaeon]
MLLLEVGPVEEAQFLFYLLPTTLGIQLGFYFLYQYYKIQDVNLKLNRILLSFGAFTFLMVFGALFINVTRTLQVFGGTETDIFTRIGWACALCSPIGFLSFIAIEEFSSIMNLKLVKTIIVLGFTPIIVVLLSGTSPIFLGTLPFAVLGAYYIIGFQIKLIRRTMGNIHKRFLQFFTGELLSFASIPFAVTVGIGVFESPLSEIVYFSGVGLLTTGFVILFISAYDFPPFYEFEWKEDLLKFFVINQKKNTCLYYCNIEEILQQLDAPIDLKIDFSRTSGDRIFSGGILGIEAVITTVTGTKDTKINEIRQEDSLILLEYGKNPSYITYALIVKKDLKSIRHFLQSLTRVFELLFREVLLKLDDLKEDTERIFIGFDGYMKDFLKR